MITRDTTNALRAKACEIVAALGYVLDQISIADQVIANPNQAQQAADAEVIAKYIGEACRSVEKVVEEAHLLSVALDVQKERAQAALRELNAAGVARKATP